MSSLQQTLPSTELNFRRVVMRDAEQPELRDETNRIVAILTMPTAVWTRAQAFIRRETQLVSTRAPSDTIC